MKSKKILIVILSFLIVVLGVVGGAYAYYVSNLSPVSEQSQEVDFVIESGESVDSVLSRLETEGIIHDALMTKVYMRLSELTNIKAGNFILDTSWNTKQIVAHLNDSTKAGSEQVMITITEGMWAKDIAKKMEQHTNVTAEELLTLWNDKDYIVELSKKYSFITEECLNSQRVYLEGYLFPETYMFLEKTSARAITERFLNHTQSILDKYADQIAATEMSMHEVMTLASIVQYEGSSEKDMKLISGVFMNRIDMGMKLQSSVTVCYALYEFDDWMDCETNYQMASDYNTYYINGLPPGPILNPGEVAIKAVLEPTESDYLYFMADVYGDGTVYYAKTYAEHARNVSKYLY